MILLLLFNGQVDVMNNPRIEWQMVIKLISLSYLQMNLNITSQCESVKKKNYFICLLRDLIKR